MSAGKELFTITRGAEALLRVGRLTAVWIGRFAPCSALLTASALSRDTRDFAHRAWRRGRYTLTKSIDSKKRMLELRRGGRIRHGAGMVVQRSLGGHIRMLGAHQ